MAVTGARPTRAGNGLTRMKIGQTPDEDPITQPCKLPDRFRGTLFTQHKAIWQEYISLLFWLTKVDEPKATMWVDLWVEYNADPVAMGHGRIQQMRVLGSELGMDPGNRARVIGSYGGGHSKKNGKAKDLANYS